MSTVKLTINFNDPEADSEERNEEVQELLEQLKDLDEVVDAGRVLDPNPPQGSKAITGFLVGLLTAEIKPENFKKVMGFLSNRLSNKPIEMEIEIGENSKKIKVKTNSREDFEAAIKAAQNLIS